MQYPVTDLQRTGHEGVAWVVCTENSETQAEGTPPKRGVLAINIVEQRKDCWKMVHHHGSPVLTNPSGS